MINLNQIIRAIQKLVMKPIEELQDTTKRFSEPLTLDLSVARSEVEYKIYGDVMIVESMDGIATVCLNNKENSPLELRIGRKIYQDFFTFFITNTAQAGKTLKIVVGREGCFDITETDYWLNLLKDKQDEAKVVLDGVKVGTDKIISAAATAAKQDLAKTAIDLVKTSTDLTKDAVDTLAAAAATAAKQDVLKIVTNNIKDTMDGVWDEVSGLSAEKLHSNRGFETGDLTGFSRDGGGTETVQSGVKKWGSYAVQLEVPDSTATAIYNTDMVEVNEGDIVILSGWMKADAEIDSSYIGMYKYGSDGSYQGAVGGELQGNNYDWKKVEEEFTIPEGVRNVRIQVMFTNYGDTAYGYMDELSLKIKSRMRTILDSVQVGTDKIVASGATEAKQDALATAINNVKIGTDKIVASGATEAKQDTIIDGIETLQDLEGASIVYTRDDDTLMIQIDSGSQKVPTSLTYVKVGEILLGGNGIVHPHCNLYAIAAGKSVFADLRLNGISQGGAEWDNVYWSGGNLACATVTIEAGDLVSLWIKCEDLSYPGYWKEFQLYGIKYRGTELIIQSE